MAFFVILNKSKLKLFLKTSFLSIKSLAVYLSWQDSRAQMTVLCPESSFSHCVLLGGEGGKKISHGARGGCILAYISS